ncbi:MAG: VanZ family protein [Lachnospiraceae bacterium]|nr:VanZ family protein [Lachnospiraceae bacterium]
MLCYFLFFAESMGRAFSEREYHYNLLPFKEISRFWTYRKSLGFVSVALNLAGNVLAFIPFGAFLPGLYARCRRFLSTAVLCFEFSLCVEVIQLVWKVGSFDVDDILLNTLGGILGYMGYSIYCKLKGLWRKQKS